MLRRISLKAIDPERRGIEIPEDIVGDGPVTRRHSATSLESSLRAQIPRLRVTDIETRASRIPMKAKLLLSAAGLLACVAGCTTTPVNVSRAPIRADAHFTIPSLDVSQVDIPPKVVTLNHPSYHIGLPKDGAGEYAVVRFVIDTDGIPREVQWVEASDAVFARAAAASAAASRYQPARMDGKVVAAKVELRFEVRYAAGAGSFWTVNGGHDYQARGMQNRYDASGIFVSNYQHQ